MATELVFGSFRRYEAKFDPPLWQVTGVIRLRSDVVFETVALQPAPWEHESMAALRREDGEKRPVEERLRLIEEVWETIREKPDDLLLMEVPRAELDRRLAAHEADPDAARDLDEILDDLRRL